MLIDGRQLAPDTTLCADICIIGTGMGAISAAHPLVRAGRDVLFVETGPITASRRDPPSVRIESVGRPFGISTSRGLEVGGGTAFWHGVCAPLDEEDFLERPWIPHSGWPITRGTSRRGMRWRWTSCAVPKMASRQAAGLAAWR